MGKIITTIQNRFHEGMTNDRRNSYESSQNGVLIARPRASIIQNFDVLTASSKMIPHYDDQVDNTGNTEQLCMYLTYGATAKQYGLGVVSGTSRVKIFERASLPQGAWGASTSGQDSTNARDEKVFIAYNDGTSDLIFGLTGLRYIWQYNITTPAFSGTLFDLTSYTNSAQGLVHSKDDILYLFIDNKVYKKNASAAFVLALTLPVNSIITSAWESGNYIAIATRSKGLGGKSYIYYWNRDSSFATLSEKVDGEYNDIRWGESIAGYEIVCSVTTNTSITARPKVIFSYVLGSGLKTIDEFNATNTTVLFGRNIQKINGRIYFMMNVEISGTVYMGLWSIGQNKQGQFAYCMEHQLNNGGTTFTASDSPKGFEILGDYVSIAYDIAGTFVARMINKDVFSNNSDFESLIFNDGDSDLTKKLKGATVMFEPLSTAGITGTPRVILSYKADGEASFTQIFSFTSIAAGSFVVGNRYVILSVGTTDFTLIGASANTIGVTFIATGVGTGNGTAVFNSRVSHGAVNIESSGDPLPEYKEIEFRIQSRGNAVITGLKWKSEIIDRVLY